MFTSISNATPKSTVTTSFTATEACTVDVGATYTVRVNGQTVTSRPIGLVVNDVIQLDIVAPVANVSVFIPWSYNGVQSHFAVVSGDPLGRPFLKPEYSGKAWYEYAVDPSAAISSKYMDGVESVLRTDGNSNSMPAQDAANILEPLKQDGAFYRYYFYVPSVIVAPYKRLFDDPVVSATSVFNGSNRTWETYILLRDMASNVVAPTIQMLTSSGSLGSNGAMVGARCVFSDNINLFVGGDNFLRLMANPSTVLATYSVADTIIYGAALANTVMAVGKSGAIYQLINGKLTQIYKSGTVGAPTVFQDQIVFPIVEEHKLRIYNALGEFVKDFDCGSNLPWAVAAYRDQNITVTYADSSSVDTYSSLSDSVAPTRTTFRYRVTYALSLGTTVYANHYLSGFDLTIPANAPVTGLDWPSLWKAPIGVDTGSGEYPISTQGINLITGVSPGATLFVNSSSSINIVNKGDRVSVLTRSTLGKKSVAIVLGSNAFDFRVQASIDSSFATFVDIPGKGYAPSTTFTIQIPPGMEDAPVALSHGTLRRNGLPYNGQTLLQGNDTLTVVLNIPQGKTRGYSMLSIADSQFALVVNTLYQTEAEVKRYQPYLSRDVTSEFTITDTGVYDFPNYSLASVVKNGNVLSFPTTLTAGEKITVHHQQMSAWWFDERDTILMGPNATYLFKGITYVNDQPNDVDFGTVHDGIPDFDFAADSICTISGLSDQYKAKIYGDHMTFKVNGGDPIEQPLVQNGDTVEAIYNVLNLWEDRFVNTTLYDGRVYPFGVVHIDPAKGQSFDPAHESYEQLRPDPQIISVSQALTDVSTSTIANDTVELTPGSTGSTAQATEVTTGTSNPVWITSEAVSDHMASTPTVVTDTTALTLASVSSRDASATVGFTSAPTSKMDDYLPEATTLASLSDFESARVNIEAYTSIPIKAAAIDLKSVDNWTPALYTPDSLLLSLPFSFVETPSDSMLYFDYDDRHEPSYGYSVNPIIVNKEAVHWLDTEFAFLSATFVFRTPENYLSKTPEWMKRHADTVLPVEVLYQGCFDTEYKVEILAEGVFDTEYKVEILAKGVFDTEYMVDPSAKFVQDLTLLEVDLQAGYVSSQTLSYKNTGVLMVDKSHYVAAPTAKVVSPLHVKNLSPRGGFSTNVAALAYGTSVAGSMVVETYQQPEGTFSFVIKRETDLVCEIRTSSIVAKAWLIGGG